MSSLAHSRVINRDIKRGWLDEDLAEVMKKLAKDKMLRAKSDVAYARGAYEKEMEQAVLLAEAKIRISWGNNMKHIYVHGSGQTSDSWTKTIGIVHIGFTQPLDLNLAHWCGSTQASPV